MLRFKHKKSHSVYKGSPNKRLYAIGDVHGCYTQMRKLLALIEADFHQANEKKNRESVIVFLGDLIDRGPNSKDVLEYLISSPPRFAKTYCLKGNHEEMLLKVLRDDPALIPQWLVYGGASCVESYRIDSQKLSTLEPDDMQIILRKYIPASHLNFIDDMHDCINFGDFFLVHAGVDIELSRDEQNPSTMRWIREPFLKSKKDLGYRVVHGHTITPKPDITINRIGIDTGCYDSGVLTALVIEDETLRYIST